MSIEFQAWPKTPRLFRDMVVTEKIDGTNSAIIIQPLAHGDSWQQDTARLAETAEGDFLVAAQSRNRLITPGKSTDNHGFAAFVHENADDLVHMLGKGRHFGEWWGSGIQRGYGLQNGEKRFSLFNVKRYAGISGVFKEIDTVPVLAEGPFDLDDVRVVLDELRREGSFASPGFMNPEGVVVFHEAAGQIFKATIENDAAPKSLKVAA